MNRMKGLAAILGVAVLMVVVAACGSNQLDTGEGQTEIAQALVAAEGSEVTVSGHLIVDSGGNARLCSVLLESGPPQCGGDRIDLLGFDASSVPNSNTPQRPSEIQTARWTDSYITVTGLKGIGGLAEGGYVNRCVNDIRRRPSQPLIQWRFHPHTVHRGRRLRSTQGPSDA